MLTTFGPLCVSEWIVWLEAYDALVGVTLLLTVY